VVSAGSTTPKLPELVGLLLPELVEGNRFEERK
jgi:hypothetical protein